MTLFPPHPERRPAVVTGASSGIGAATALALAELGMPVALGARRVERCEKIAAQIREQGGESVAHPLDLADPASVEAFAEATGRDLGEIEVVVSNAARLGVGQVHEVPTDRVADELAVNITGAHRLVRAFVPGMVQRRRGDIVFLSSDVAGRARPRMSAYAASKWGLEGMVHAMQMELEGSGVRASMVRPGPTRTEMGSDWDDADTIAVLEDWERWGLARHSHFLEPAAIARAVAAVVDAPRGTHLTMVEVQPEAPVEER
jgi:NAD(P)-dependent dehydrogenase (short-subunit alcohol dehydrogenase family)